MAYVKSMGPGIVLVLTWLGAGDIVSAATSGGNYGYALMWVFVLCLLFRYVFVSIIAKYQLCNQTGTSILGGLARVHRLYPPFILICAVLVGHSVETYLLTGASAALGASQASKAPSCGRFSYA
jgi:Mn2+/Fe2+ NRAMP family transporter